MPTRWWALRPQTLGSSWPTRGPHQRWNRGFATEPETLTLMGASRCLGAQRSPLSNAVELAVNNRIGLLGRHSAREARPN